MKDFFISYNSTDKTWAEWIAWQLEEAGYSLIIQAWDFRPGRNFVLEMQKAAAQCARTLAVLSPYYLDAEFTHPEWAAAFAQDPKGEKGKLLAVRVRDCELSGLLAPIIYIDLVGLVESAAKETLLEGVKQERAKPAAAPTFPAPATAAATATATAASSLTKHLIAEPPRFPGALPPVWNIPHRRNPNFSGREDILAALKKALASGQPAALTQAITGLGGIGKTQVAIEYAYRHAGNYEAVWWLRCEEPETLAADYAGFARAQNLPEKDIPEQEQIIAAVRRWLEGHSGWLLIFDNATDPAEIRHYLPRAAAGHTLITSRHRDWDTLGGSVSLPTWPREEAVTFLLQRTGQAGQEAAAQLAEELGDLPLALEQAAAYIKAARISFAAYLNLFRSRRRELWQMEKAPADYHRDTVATTWSLAMQEVKQTAPAGAEILNFCAFLGAENIPRSLLQQAARFLPEQPRELLQYPLTLNRGIEALSHYSLIGAELETLSLHRLVQAVARDRLSDEEKRARAEAAIKTLAEVFPGEGYNTPRCWPQCAELFPHARAAVEYAEELQAAAEETATLLNSIASYLYGRAAYLEAEKLLRWALAIREGQLRPDHPDIATSLNNLALLLETQKKYEDAEPLHRRALAIREGLLGSDHPETAESLNNLAALLYAQGKHGEAEPLYRRALAIHIATFGKDHPRVATGLNNLALLLEKQGKYEEAEPLHRQALEIREAQLAKDHPDVAVSLNNLAGLLKTQGKVGEAEPLYRRALKICEKTLGKDHPNTQIARKNLERLLAEKK